MKALKGTITETDGYKRTDEAEKIEKEENLEEISNCNAEIETKISEAEDEVDRLQQLLVGKNLEEENHVREEQLKFEVKLEETKLQVQQTKSQDSVPGDAGASKTETAGSLEGMAVRLPKINTTQFRGAYMDWLSIWGQFVDTVDKSNIAAINKFTYLCVDFLGRKSNVVWSRCHLLQKDITEPRQFYKVSMGRVQISQKPT